ncbi:uncharacterized protein TNCV_4908091 [Trichonephila clavipes]|uniref:Transposase n=1 Tax=Trichonephila clavipes TaxID=2585209 RepID=A0A8X6RPG0_TRICX|nr:uncharacterized protein TNCV_4908091 [Trichonephila clavipes]
MITNFFIPELNNHDVQELWFQQDAATCHTARATIDLLKDTFGDCLISRFGPVNWPPRSCDLTPLDYFLWGYVKSLVYADKPQTLDHLEGNIRSVIADIRPQMLEKIRALTYNLMEFSTWPGITKDLPCEIVITFGLELCTHPDYKSNEAGALLISLVYKKLYVNNNLAKLGITFAIQFLSNIIERMESIEEKTMTAIVPTEEIMGTGGNGGAMVINLHEPMAFITLFGPGASKDHFVD